MNWEDILDRAYPVGRRNAVFYRRAEADDLRLGEWVRTWDRTNEIEPLLASKPAVFIIGAPDDLGVVMAQGRPGARHGPQAIRKAFYRLTPGFLPEWAGRVVDMGDIRVSDQEDPEARLAETHLRLEEVVYYLSLSGARVVVLGGGQDFTYSSVTGFTKARKTLHEVAREGDAPVVDWFGLINVDKFLDVRDPQLTDGNNSGTSFFRLLEQPEGPIDPANYVAFALQEQHCSPKHRQYLLSKGARLVSLEQFWLGRENVLNEFKRALEVAGDGAVGKIVSFDMNSTVLPGVSAPSPLGLQPGTCCALASMSGEEGVDLFEIMETAPPHDNNQQLTSVLAANMLFYYLRGLAARELE